MKSKLDILFDSCLEDIVGGADRTVCSYVFIPEVKSNKFDKKEKLSITTSRFILCQFLIPHDKVSMLKAWVEQYDEASLLL